MFLCNVQSFKCDKGQIAVSNSNFTNNHANLLGGGGYINVSGLGFEFIDIY